MLEQFEWLQLVGNTPWQVATRCALYRSLDPSALCFNLGNGSPKQGDPICTNQIMQQGKKIVFNGGDGMLLSWHLSPYMTPMSGPNREHGIHILQLIYPTTTNDIHVGTTSWWNWSWSRGMVGCRGDWWGQRAMAWSWLGVLGTGICWWAVL